MIGLDCTVVHINRRIETRSFVDDISSYFLSQKEVIALTNLCESAKEKDIVNGCLNNEERSTTSVIHQIFGILKVF